ncbi:MAG: hypothetical protein M1501_04090 [Candidatus Omnitrophica bacterium]|nr:hypothetical protein [Candidatus Omnitrophota bacterium]
MKSINATLKLIAKEIHRFSTDTQYDIKSSLIGGQAIISYGIPRTSLDIDICMVIMDNKNNYIDGKKFTDFLLKELPDFNIKFHRGTDIEDSLKHDFIRLQHKKNIYPIIDIIFANYKWEIESIKESIKVKNIPIPVLPKKYLIAMKLKAGGLKDILDINDLFQLMSKKEKQEVFDLTVYLRIDKKLRKIVNINSL